MGIQQFDEVQAILHEQKLITSSGTSKQNVAINSTNAEYIESWWACSDDTVDHLVQLWYSTTLIGIVTVPAGAGQGTVPAVNLMNTVNAALGAPVIKLMAQKAIAVQLLVAMTAAKSMWVGAAGGILLTI
jgi:hypothetical protein